MLQKQNIKKKKKKSAFILDTKWTNELFSLGFKCQNDPQPGADMI